MSKKKISLSLKVPKVGRPKKTVPTPCMMKGCPNEAHARGLCKTHYNKLRNEKGRSFLKSSGYVDPTGKKPHNYKPR